MIKSISIRNFMALESLDLELTAPLNIITGQNETGKSSIRDSLLWAFTGQARGLKTHADQAALIREGAKSAEVQITLNTNQTATCPTFVRRKTLKTAATVSGEVPDIGLNPAILFDPHTFLFLPEAQRRELLFQVIPGLNPTANDICSRLINYFSPTDLEAADPDSKIRTAIDPLASLAASSGFPAAGKEAVTRRREAKRVLESLSGVKEPEKTVTIDGQEYDIPTLNSAAIEGTLKELQAQKDALLRQKGAAEARARRRDQIKVQLDRINALVPPDASIITVLEKELADLNESIKKATDEIAKAQTRQEYFPATCPVITLAITACPNAGQGVGQEPPAPGVIEALQQNKAGFAKAQAQAIQKLQEARRQNEEYNVAMGRKAALEEELAKLESESDPLDIDAEIATRERRIARGRAFQKEIEDYGRDSAEFQAAQEKVATCEQEIALYDALAKALAPDGIPSQMIAEALDGVNERLYEASTYLFPQRTLGLTENLDIELSGSPFATLSKSAKFRVGIAFQYALARLSGARLLMIDEADILDCVHRVELINFLLTHISDFDQIFVFFTSDQPFCVAAPRVQSWWLENGRLTKVIDKSKSAETNYQRHLSDHERGEPLQVPGDI